MVMSGPGPASQFLSPHFCRGTLFVIPFLNLGRSRHLQLLKGFDFFFFSSFHFFCLTQWIKGHFTHTRLRARDQYTSSTAIGGKCGAGPSSFHTTLEGPTEYVNCKMDVKSTMDSYMAPNGSCFMLKNHLLEVGLTQLQETMALRMLIFVDLF
jgi:hypothetical protein